MAKPQRERARRPARPARDQRRRLFQADPVRTFWTVGHSGISASDKRQPGGRGQSGIFRAVRVSGVMPGWRRRQAATHAPLSSSTHKQQGSQAVTTWQPGFRDLESRLKDTAAGQPLAQRGRQRRRRRRGPVAQRPVGLCRKLRWGARLQLLCLCITRSLGSCHVLVFCPDQVSTGKCASHFGTPAGCMPPASLPAHFDDDTMIGDPGDQRPR